MFLLINKKTESVLDFDDLGELAVYIEAEQDEISEAIKGRGRWDSPNQHFVVILDLPDEN